MAKSKFLDSYCISQGGGAEGIDLSPNSNKALHFQYYKFSSLLGTTLETKDNDNTLYITQPWIYFVCQLQRDGLEFTTPDNFDLVCKVKMQNGVEKDITIFFEKVWGQFIGYNYEGDTALVAFKITSAHFKAVDEIISFTPTIRGSSSVGSVSKTYTITATIPKEELYWNGNNLGMTDYTDQNTRKLKIQDWYDFDASLFSYYNNGTKSTSYYNNEFRLDLQQDTYLTMSNRSPDFIRFQYDDSTSDTYRITNSVASDTRSFTISTTVQKNIIGVNVGFSQTIDEVTYDKVFTMQNINNFKYYTLAINDLEFNGVFEIKQIDSIQNNEFKLSSVLKGQVKLPNDFPYEYVSGISFGFTSINVTYNNKTFSFDYTEKITGTITGNAAEKVLTTTKDPETLIFTTGLDYKLRGTFKNKFTETVSPIAFNIQDFNKTNWAPQYILCTGVSYEIATTGNISIPGQIVLPGEQIKITMPTTSNYIVNTQTLQFLTNTAINFAKSICYYGQEKRKYLNNFQIEGSSLTYNNLQKFTNETSFIKIEPIVSFTTSGESAEIKKINTIIEEFSLGRLSTLKRKTSFQSFVDGTILKTIFTDYGGDKNIYYRSDYFIDNRIKNQGVPSDPLDYFSLSRKKENEDGYFSSERIKATFSIEDEDETTYYYYPTDLASLRKVLNFFREDRMVEFDLATLTGFDKDDYIGKTFSLTLEYEYTKDTYTRTLLVVTFSNLTITAGTRSLGLRRGGIIVSPTDTNEELPTNVVERINLKNQVNQDIYSGNAIEIVARTPSGQIMQDENGNNITCNISFEGKKENKDGKDYYSGDFYFDGVNVSALKNTVDNSTTGLVKKVGDLETTVGNSGSGLVKDVNDNKADITDLKALSKVKFYTGANTSNVEVKDTDYALTSIAISTSDDLSSAYFMGTVEFNGHRVSGHINYAPSGNSNNNSAHSGIYYDSSSKRIIVDIILQNDTIVDWTFHAGEIRVKVLAIY